MLNIIINSATSNRSAGVANDASASPFIAYTARFNMTSKANIAAIAFCGSELEPLGFLESQKRDKNAAIADTADGVASIENAGKSEHFQFLKFALK
jgi:hypothetical protein